MPPRKKAKASAASTPLRDTQPKTPQDSGLAQSQEELLSDAWADEQETQLLKSVMKWKPTGFHKHFRMINIHIDMHSHGFASDDAPHTRIPGIWKKLGQWYDLDALDTRENEFAFSDEPDPAAPDEALHIPDFELPEDVFGELMWNKRFHRETSAAASSPPMVPIQEYRDLYAPGMGLLKDFRDSVPSQKAESVTEATPTPKNARGTTRTGRTAKAGKGSKAAAKNTKAQSTVSESAEEEDQEDDQEESSVQSEQDNAPTTRRTNRAKPKPAPKRTRKR
ncbi:CT20-domain-containing protein [Decorospora gaudefroyi]|uniref:CT20-domain-containing protein n=1 Tax=Decorospora gaudefroyi TaxID=184978 RepID=A0A6A5K482_9PLEO|nr:CT20-domain-containing protein [Decorospora gaudefroyi]